MADKHTPAFPLINYLHAEGFEPGMTLRDYFAGQALVGSIARIPAETGAEIPLLAEEAYRIADAMLAARDRGE